MRRALEELRVAAVGKKGEISLKMRELGKMSPEERQVAGPALNALKDEVNAAITPRRPRWPTPRWMSG
jgi:phenylalanyl-tRNA synthetase alpha chain